MLPLRIGVVGCGNISPIYLKNLSAWEETTVVAVSDLNAKCAEDRAREFGVPQVLGVRELVESPDVDLVLNLTVPHAHHDVARLALEAGKHVYNEKPLAIARAEGAELLELAARKGVRVGGAPDTFLGAGIQTCLQAIRRGDVGEPVAAQAAMLCHGHEGWHPSPEFYYQVGGGPMFDMGPYYLTALVALMGPVRAVTGMTRITFPERTIGSEPKRGQTIRVEVPTHVCGLLEFASGALGTIVTSFDVWGSVTPPIELHGSEASLLVPDPNMFGGRPQIRRAGDRDWSDLPLVEGYAENARGLGVRDMALAIRDGRPHRASGELAQHVLDIMHAVHESAERGERVTLSTTARQPEAMPG